MWDLALVRMVETVQVGLDPILHRGRSTRKADAQARA